MAILPTRLSLRHLDEIKLINNSNIRLSDVSDERPFRLIHTVNKN